MQRAEQLKILAPEQYGSRHGYAAIHQSLNLQVTFDLFQQWKIPAAVCSNDAKACYDRIVHAFAVLAIQQLGIPLGPIQVMFGTIQQLHHYIQTIHGDSDVSFTNNASNAPIQGIGQGNGVGLQIWAVVSSPIFDMVRNQGHGATFCASTSGNLFHFVGFGFVDDVDLVSVSNIGHVSNKEILQSMQSNLDLWETGLHTSGGALLADKSRWTFIDFSWNQGHWMYLPQAKLPGQLTMRDVSGDRKTLTCLESWEAERALGLRLAPDGNTKAEFLHRLNQANTWAAKISLNKSSKHAN